MESGNLGFGIRNTAQGIRVPTNDWIRNPILLTNTGIQYLESGILRGESRIQDCNGFHYKGRHTCFPGMSRTSPLWANLASRQADLQTYTIYYEYTTARFCN